MLVIDNAGKKKYDNVGNTWQCDHLGIAAFDFSWLNCL